MDKKIYLSSPHMSEENYELEFIKEAFDTNWIAPLGKNVTEFENEIMEYTGSKQALALSSGTSAIHLALIAAGVKRGDIVICQSLTFAATANPIIYQGAIPVFIDSEDNSWNIDPIELKKALIKFPSTKAVLIVHLYGISARIQEIQKICSEHKVVLIEDAAESLGTIYKGQYTGTFGDYGIFSFNGNKIITTSGGGMLIAKQKNKIDKARFWSTQSRENARHYEHKELGFNYRMSNVLAGIGRGQLKVLETRIGQKRYIFNYYKKHLSDLEDLNFVAERDNERSNYWLSVIILNGKIRPMDVILALEKHNIESRPVWKPMHMQPFYRDFEFFGTNKAEKLFSNGVCLPSDTKMADEDLKIVVEIIRSLWSK